MASSALLLLLLAAREPVSPNNFSTANRSPAALVAEVGAASVSAASDDVRFEAHRAGAASVIAAAETGSARSVSARRSTKSKQRAATAARSKVSAHGGTAGEARASKAPAQDADSRAAAPGGAGVVTVSTATSESTPTTSSTADENGSSSALSASPSATSPTAAPNGVTDPTTASNGMTAVSPNTAPPTSAPSTSASAAPPTAASSASPLTAPPAAAPSGSMSASPISATSAKSETSPTASPPDTPNGMPAASPTIAPSTLSAEDVGRIAAEAGIAALRAAAVAIQVPESEVQARYTRGLTALQAKDTRTAIGELSSCVAASPSRADCRWELGWAYSLENRWADALEQWTQVQRLNPQQPELEAALTQARGQAALQARLAQWTDGTPRPPPPLGAKVRIRATGDVMLGTTVPEGNLPPEGGGSVIANVRSLLEDADLTFVNLEGPLCDNGITTKCRSPKHCYAFRSPTSFGQFLQEAGVDVAGTANNHSGDFGESCRRETEATLDAHGIAWSGPPGSVATMDRNGLRIGLVAFHTSASCNFLNDLPTATALVRSVAATHDIVVVSFHGGAEGGKALHVPAGRELFFGEDRGNLRVFTHAVVDAGAHLVIGHGPHVARAMEFYQGRLIAYSMGNFATYGRFNLKGPQGLGMVLEVELDREGHFTTGRILPTKQVGEGITMPDPAGGVIKQVRQLTREDFPETGAQVAEDGTLSPRTTSLPAVGSMP
ncbi:CapA family protein [Myxococcaceae bacterium JPH2]|nr:CapA family protein [Myxococcaceae bacterium JPH2]